MFIVEWQPIETAPKDGESILVFNSYGISEVQWCNEQDYDVPHDWWYIDGMKAGYFGLRGDEPTHWMPLPAPPST